MGWEVHGFGWCGQTCQVQEAKLSLNQREELNQGDRSKGLSSEWFLMSCGPNGPASQVLTREGSHHWQVLSHDGLETWILAWGSLRSSLPLAIPQVSCLSTSPGRRWKPKENPLIIILIYGKPNMPIPRYLVKPREKLYGDRICNTDSSALCFMYSIFIVIGSENTCWAPDQPDQLFLLHLLLSVSAPFPQPSTSRWSPPQLPSKPHAVRPRTSLSWPPVSLDPSLVCSPATFFGPGGGESPDLFLSHFSQCLVLHSAQSKGIH